METTNGENNDYKLITFNSDVSSKPVEVDSNK